LEVVFVHYSRPREFLLGQVEHPGFGSGGKATGSKKYMNSTMRDNNASQRIIYLLDHNLLRTLGTHTGIRVVMEN
jgi:hypothetical protein